MPVNQAVVTSARSGARTLAASSDYGPAVWNPASPANFTVANRPHDYPVQMIIIHDIEGTTGSAIAHFQDPGAAASAHYVIGDNGSVTQMVAEKDIAWHAGNWDYNTRAIGIEHEGYASGTNWYTSTMYQGSAHLAASICSRWGVPMDGNHVIGHSQVPDPNNPGLFGGTDHHTDPGPNWNWSYYMAYAQLYASQLPSPPHMMPEPTVSLNSSTSATVSWLGAQTCHDPITGYTVNGQPGNLSMSVSGGTRSATFTGLQAGVDYTFTVTATNPEGQDTLPAQWRCSSVQMSTAPAGPQLSGTAVQVSATSGGCPHPRYAFWVKNPGAADWNLAQPYGTSGAFNWDTSGLGAGTAYLSVWATDANSRSVTGYDVYVPGTAFTLTSQPCTSVTASAAPPSRSVPGNTVTLTASASGCPSPSYEFWIQAPGGSWTIAQAYSTSPSFSWNTTGLPTGAYHYSVWVRDASSAAAYDTYVPGTVYTLTTVACTSLTASAAPGSPQASGTAVTITASSSGCPNARYEFWILRPGGSWTVAQAYSSSATFNWSTAGLPAGTYRYSVWVRDAASSAAYDTFVPGTAYTLTTTPCTSVTASVAPASPQGSGTAITFTASASGCPSARYEFWIQAPGGSWAIVQAYSASATFNWNTTGLPAGTYRYSVWVRDASSASSYDVYVPGTAYTLT